MASVSLRLGDYRRTLLAALDLVTFPVALATITGPGWDALDNDPASIRRWNATAARRWAKLDRRAKSRLRRDGLRVRPLARVAQRQLRGVDHLHLVLAIETPEERHALRVYIGYLKELAPEHGFGFVDDPTRRRRTPKGEHRDMVFESPGIAGRYLCRYLSESSQLEAMVRAGDHSFRALWVSPELTQASGVNCRRLRRVRHAWHVVRALEQGSRPTLPVWWSSLAERTAVIRLVRTPTAYAYF